MGPGLLLIVLGAILAFAVRDGVPGLNLTITGVILMLAGLVVIAHSRHRERERDLERQRSLDIDEQAAVRKVPRRTTPREEPPPR